ncbi:MAG: exodeoxyribonuclease V subunit gamma, partial [Oscillospiraceae bacterium]|nr:exodeoxyribonuclease V subunit gamma [Oscillospiraceae bacterium]
VFRTPLDTYSKLLNLCRKNGCEVKTPLSLTAGEGFNSASLSLLEELLAAKLPENSANDGAVSITSALSIKQECRSVAAKIRNLVKEKGLRYRDIAVIGRDMDSYLCHLEDSFRLYDIPFFADSRSSLDCRPAVVFIINLIETIISDIDPITLIKYLKCPISPISIDEAAELENYIDLWRLGKKDMLSDFVKNPAGLDGEIDEAGLIQLSRLNEIRKAAVLPLVELKNKLYKADGSFITREIYRFMKQNGVIQKLSELTDAISETDSALAGEQYRAYQVCLSVMSQLSALLKGEYVSLKYYLELFKAAINAEDVGSIPHHLDEVQVGDAVRMRTGDIKVAFLVGMNEGVFPKRHTDSGLFSDRDRKSVRSAGIDILTPSAIMNQNEDYYLYCALTSASDAIYISYSANNMQGEPTLPSKIVNKIKNFFDIKESSLSSEPMQNLLGSDAANFELLCRTYHANDEFSKSLKQYFENYADDLYRIKLTSIDKGLAHKAQALTQEQATALYGSPMMVSPSQIEKYHLCQFSHFCRYGLRLNPLKVAEITTLDTGNAIHEVMEKLLANYSVSELALLSESELSALCDEYLKGFVSLRLGSSVFDDNRILYSIQRLKLTIVPVIRYVVRELEASGYTPRDFELDIRRGRDIEPYMISSGSGKEIGVFGKVDRVDTLKGENSTYVRVIDYKSGSKTFNRSELDYGLNLQMFLYLFSILKNGGSRYNDTLTPSGVLYMPAKRSEVTRKDGASQESINKEIEKGYKMNGILLDGEQNQRSAPFASASFNDISEFSLIQNKIEELIGKMADELISGKLAINPLCVERDNKACKFCDFHKICGFEDGDSCRMVEKTKEVRSD